MDEKTRVARELFLHMPGAANIYSDEHWETVKRTQPRHWRFCEAIAEQMLAVAVRAAQLAAEETVKRMKEEADAGRIVAVDSEVAK